jgi:hypothetical protein
MYDAGIEANGCAREKEDDDDTFNLVDISTCSCLDPIISDGETRDASCHRFHRL